jgi:hypothetical protein
LVEAVKVCSLAETKLARFVVHLQVGKKVVAQKNIVTATLFREASLVPTLTSRICFRFSLVPTPPHTVRGHVFISTVGNPRNHVSFRGSMEH